MTPAAIEIKTEARGSHWVAWVDVAPGQAAPPVPLLMVGLSREEAESRLRAWWAARVR